MRRELKRLSFGKDYQQVEMTQRTESTDQNQTMKLGWETRELHRELRAPSFSRTSCLHHEGEWAWQFPSLWGWGGDGRLKSCWSSPHPRWASSRPGVSWGRMELYDPMMLWVSDPSFSGVQTQEETWRICSWNEHDALLRSFKQGVTHEQLLTVPPAWKGTDLVPHTPDDGETICCWPLRNVTGAHLELPTNFGKKHTKILWKINRWSQF